MAGGIAPAPEDVAGTLETVSDPAFPRLPGRAGPPENSPSPSQPAASGHRALTKARLVAGPGAAFSPEVPVTATPADTETVPPLPPAMHDGEVPLPQPVVIDGAVPAAGPPVSWPNSPPPASTLPFDSMADTYTGGAKKSRYGRSNNSHLLLTAGLLFAVLGAGLGVGAMLLLELRRTSVVIPADESASQGKISTENRGVTPPHEVPGSKSAPIDPTPRDRKLPQNHVLTDEAPRPSPSGERPRAPDAAPGDRRAAWTQAKATAQMKGCACHGCGQAPGYAEIGRGAVDPATAEAVARPLAEAAKHWPPAILSRRTSNSTWLTWLRRRPPCMPRWTQGALCGITPIVSGMPFARACVRSRVVRNCRSMMTP